MRSKFLAILVAFIGVIPAADIGSGGLDDSARWLEQLHRRTPSVRQEAVRAALDAVECAKGRGLVTSARVLTVIDYSLPSKEPRLWVIDLTTRRLLFEELVAHGRNSGENMSVHFSNEPNSLATSLGLFLTGDTYIGRNGYSLRLEGLEPGINDNARERAVVIHGAPYVSEAATQRLGRLGRSWGCPALRPAIARELIDVIRGGSPVFAYYPERGSEKTSRLASGCEVKAD